MNESYPKRGIFKAAALKNASSDQKLTIDLSPDRVRCIPPDLMKALSAQGLEEVLTFFNRAVKEHVPNVLRVLGTVTGADFKAPHQSQNINFRICDYIPDTADPKSRNGCGAHTDYGTFSIIFQDRQSGLEIEDANAPDTWIPVPGDATVLLCGWCAVILSGNQIKAARHRVRRTAGVRRLSAVLFVAPDLDQPLKPITGTVEGKPFSQDVRHGIVTVRSFKETMGKKWRWREGNGDPNDLEPNNLGQRGGRCY